jgi:hypothetical protein
LFGKVLSLVIIHTITNALYRLQTTHDSWTLAWGPISPNPNYFPNNSFNTHDVDNNIYV